MAAMSARPPLARERPPHQPRQLNPVGTRMKSPSALLVLAACLGGCAAVVEPGTGQGPKLADPLVSAFSQRLDDLEKAAEQGDLTAQFSLSIIRADGLRGQPRDEAMAAAWRRRALAGGASTQITQYTAGINGAPGRVNTISLPGRRLSPVLVQMTDDCVTVLKARSREASYFVPHTSVFEQPGGYAAYEQAESQAAETCGGLQRYGMLTHLWDQAAPWGERPLPSCAADQTRCQVLSGKIARLNNRNPAAEARAAALRGDFRLGAYNSIGPMPQGWSLPGVECSQWRREQISKWHVNQDVVSSGDREHSSASIAFIAAYNRSIVTDPAFPFADVCSETLVAPADHYAGPVRTWSEAARSGDVGTLRTMTGLPGINTRDALGLTALDWAMAREDGPMASALLDAGAHPNLNAPDQKQPLALALAQRQVALARRMMDAGATMTRHPDICDRGPMFGPPPDLSVNRGCSWAGLLIKANAFDLLDAEAAKGALDRPSAREPMVNLTDQPREVSLDPLGEIQAAFFAAIDADDETTAMRLLPHVGHGEGNAGRVLDRLVTSGQTNLVIGFVLARGWQAARSDSEATIWRQAAEKGHADIIAFLSDYGADLNLLSAARLAECEAAARDGQIANLLTCVDEAGQRRLRVQETIEAGDDAAFAAALADVSSVNEWGKATQLAIAADRGTPIMVKTLIERGALPRGFFSSNRQVSLYSGELKDRADAVAASVRYSEVHALGQPPARRAADRHDARSLRLLIDAGAPNLFGLLDTLGNLGNYPPGLENALMRDQTVSYDNEALPNRAVDRDFEAFQLLAAEVARVYGPQSLSEPFSSALFSGYNDALQVMLDNGLDLSKVRQPERLWSSWSSLGNPCKPSTGRLLVRNGLTREYAPSNYTNWPPLHAVAAGCMDARSAAMLVSEAGMAVNALDVTGNTPIDVALSYRRRSIVDTLARLGGLPASQAAPRAHAATKQHTRDETDLDLVQSDAT